MCESIYTKWLFASLGQIIWSGHAWGMNVKLVVSEDSGRKLEVRISVDQRIYQICILYAMLHPEGRSFRGARIVYGNLPNPTVSFVWTPIESDAPCDAKTIEDQIIKPLMTQLLTRAKEMRQLIGILQRIDTLDTDYDWEDYCFERLGLEEDKKEKIQ
jgi:hypothetical protein